MSVVHARRRASRSAEEWEIEWQREVASIEPLAASERNRLAAGVRALYLHSGLPEPLVLTVPSPLASLLVGALGAAVRAILHRGALACHLERVRHCLDPRHRFGRPAEDARLVALLRRIAEAPAAPERKPKLGGSYPHHWTEEDCFLWAVTSNATRQAIDRAMVEHAYAFGPGEPMRHPSPVRPDRRRAIAILLTSLDSALQAIAWRDQDETAGTMEILKSYDRVSEALFGAGSELGKRLRCMAPRMIDPGSFASPEHLALARARHDPKFSIDTAWWDAWCRSAVGGPRLIHEEFCLVSDRPERLLFDADGRAHAADGPFVRWRDGLSLHAIHGVRVDARIVEQPGTLTLSEIDHETNAEVRRVMIELYGPRRFLRDGGATVLDHSERFGTLFRRELPGGRPPLMMVEVVNRTPESDGTFRHYFLRVHHECRPLLPGGRLGEPQALTARAAVASTWGLRAEKYDPELES